MPDPCIVALGGGGFSTEPDNPRLDDYINSLAGKTRPKLCFVPTASGDSDNYIVRFYDAFTVERCEPSHLRLFSRKIADLSAFVLSQDVIYVGGGATAGLLAVWRLHGLDVIFREAWERGIVLCGVSAGALCWFEAGATDSFGKPLRPLRDGLGFSARQFLSPLRRRSRPAPRVSPDDRRRRRPAGHRGRRRGGAGLSRHRTGRGGLITLECARLARRTGGGRCPRD